MNSKELRIKDIVVRKTTTKTHDDAIKGIIEDLRGAYIHASLLDGEGAIRTIAKRELQWAVEQVLRHVRTGWHDDCKVVMCEMLEQNKKVQD